MRYRVLMFAAFLSALAACAGPAAAQPYRAREGVQSGQMRSLDQILNGIRRQRPGSLADVQGPNASPEGGAQYRLKWITPDGRVLWLDTDARTGQVLGVEGEDRGPPPGAAPGPPQAYGPPGYPPGYGRVPPGYPVQPGVPQPQAYGPPPGYGPPVVVRPPVVGPPFGGPRGFILRNGPGRGPPPGVPRGGPGRGREFRR